MTTVTGSDVLNQSVSALVKKNQSTNETNLARSLKTSNTTDTNKYTTTDDKIFGEVTTQSSKKKTFGVYATKQVVEDITPDTQSPVSDKIETIPVEEVNNLSNKTDIPITNDMDHGQATRQALVNTKQTVDESYTRMSDSNLSPSVSFAPMKTWAPYLAEKDDGLIGQEDFTPSVAGSPVPITEATMNGPASMTVSPITGATTATPAHLLGDTNESSVIETIPGKESNRSAGGWSTIIDKDQGGVPSYAVPKVEVASNYVSDPNVRTYIPDTMSLDEFKQAQTVMNGDIGDRSTCPDLNSAFNFDTDISDLNELSESLKGLLDFGIDTSWMDCFSDMLGSLPIGDTRDMFSSILGNGDIGSADKFLGNVSSSIIDNPGKTLLDLGNTYQAVADPKSGGIVKNLKTPSEASTMDSLLTSLGVTKRSLLSTSNTSNSKNNSIGSVIEIIDTPTAKSTNPNNGLLDYVLGKDDADLLRALPI